MDPREHDGLNTNKSEWISHNQYGVVFISLRD